MVIMLIAVSGCFGDGVFEISGTVRDQDGAPIEAAEIVFLDTTGGFKSRSVHSEADGSFFFEEVCSPNPRGTRLVSITCKEQGFVPLALSKELNDVTKDYKIVLNRLPSTTDK
ncbi:MAG: carboxypeptidase-like regulatory domain-containing protein [Planctomycetaceae bacterium]